MSRKRKKELIRCEYLVWLLGQRRSNGVYQADGRSNEVNAGRHSLGTRDRDEALAALKDLDRRIAVGLGLAPVAVLIASPGDPGLAIDAGVRFYLEGIGGPAVTGGVAGATANRYRSILDKFIAFAATHGIPTWQRLGNAGIRAYAQWLEDEEYKYSTQYLELTTIVQVARWLADHGHLSEACVPRQFLDKPDETTTYCYRQEEFAAMVERCRSDPRVAWLAPVVVGLGHAGLRIGELAELRWSDVDLERGILGLPDRSRRGTRAERAKARRTKGRRSRWIPIHPALRQELDRLPRHPDGRVFHGPTGGSLKPDTVRNVLIEKVIGPLAGRFPSVSDEPGFVDGRLHSFRHYFCSVCADAGVAERMLMDWMGHKDSAMVRRYYHGNRQEARRRMEQITFLPPATPASTPTPAAPSTPPAAGEPAPPQSSANPDAAPATTPAQQPASSSPSPSQLPAGSPDKCPTGEGPGTPKDRHNGATAAA